MKFIAVLCIVTLISCGGNSNQGTPVPAPPKPTSAELSKGEELFKNKCYQCHRCDMELTGPMLRGSLERWNGDKKTMFEFVRNSQEVIKTNVYAQGLYKKYNQTFMNPFPDLTDADIEAIMSYCK
jgi:cytochrome c2